MGNLAVDASEIRAVEVKYVYNRRLALRDVESQRISVKHGHTPSVI